MIEWIEINNSVALIHKFSSGEIMDNVEYSYFCFSKKDVIWVFLVLQIDS